MTSACLKTLSFIAPRNCTPKNGPKRRSANRRNWLRSVAFTRPPLGSVRPGGRELRPPGRPCLAAEVQLVLGAVGEQARARASTGPVQRVFAVYVRAAGAGRAGDAALAGRHPAVAVDLAVDVAESGVARGDPGGFALQRFARMDEIENGVAIDRIAHRCSQCAHLPGRLIERVQTRAERGGYRLRRVHRDGAPAGRSRSSDLPRCWGILRIDRYHIAAR